MEPKKHKHPKKPKIVFVMGGPGSGKGTQCDLLVKNQKFHHLSTGDLLREEVKQGSPLGKQIEEIQKEGKFVSSQLVVSLLKKEIEKKNVHGNDIFLIDGFPRNQDNVKEWNDKLKPHVDERVMIVFDCKEETLTKRILGRPGGRVDDNPVTVKKRIDAFLKESIPIIELYEKEKKVRKINAEGTPESIQKEVVKVLKTEKVLKKRAKICFVIGCPGSGKQRICRELAKNFQQFHQISASELIRNELKSGSIYAKAFEKAFKENMPAPSHEVTHILFKLIKSLVIFQREIKKQNKKGVIFMLNGFPRNTANTEAWTREMDHKTVTKQIIYLEAPQEKLIEKLNEKTTKKPSFTKDIAKRKLDNFKYCAMPVIDLLEKKGVLHRIKADKPMTSIIEEFKKIIEKKHVKK